MRLAVILGLLIISPYIGKALSVNGIVTDVNGESLPFANVYLKGTSIGTTTNVNGEFSLNLKPGTYTIVFQYVGYRQLQKEIQLVDETLNLSIILEPENVELSEVVIKSGEDPAYAVIRQAIKKRKYYQKQVRSYSCDVYIKGLQKITEAPDKIMGLEINIEGILDSNNTGIVYLSESESKYYFQQPDKVKEQMYSSKVSGNNKAFSWNQASEMDFNFYQSFIEIEGLSDRGFISPIAENALFFYRYRLIGTFFQDGELVNKIEVIPKRKADPVFRGIIYILEDQWRIHSTDLLLTRDANIDFIDSLNIRQTYVPINDTVWMPISQKFNFLFKILAIRGNGSYVGIYTNYVVDPPLKKRFFTNELLVIEKEANKKDSIYWEENRPVPLTEEEREDYRYKDSLRKLRDSQQYMDSIDKKGNRFKPIHMLIGYRYSRSFKHKHYDVSPLIDYFQFNTVEGFNMSLILTYWKRYENYSWIRFEPYFKYAFSSQQLYSTFKANFYYSPKRFARAGIEFGNRSYQINEEKPIKPLFNTIYTLGLEQNYMKIYDKRFIKIDHRFEIVNGIMMQVDLEHANRVPMINISDLTLKDVDDREYSSNDPTTEIEGTFLFPVHQATLFDLTLRLRYKQRYYSRPYRKIIIGSKYPYLIFKYRKGIAGLLGSDVNYDRLEVTIKDKWTMRLLGSSSLEATAGRFVNTNNMSFLDYKHFRGNRTVFATRYLNTFNLLDYYSHSTSTEYLEAHYKHHFDGFIFNKFPYLRKLKLQTVAAAHVLFTPELPGYFELSLGVENIFKIGAVDFVSSFTNGSRFRAGVLFGINFSF
ncbi:MAG: carboxypeptidase-like regulatory domain-containing protein [Bacteroidetes bacterium]|nr:carboxypeptidase-like regulatory domain-containing protein [Bacteroidota bacterium]